MKVRDAFANAYRELRDAVLPQYEHLQSNCSSFLGRILLVPLEVVKYRHVIQKRWQIRPCSLSSSSSSSAADDPPSYSEHPPSSSSAAAAVVGDTLLTQLVDDRHVLCSHFTHTHKQTHRIGGTNFNKKLRYREEHSASVVLSWCTLLHLSETNNRSTANQPLV